MPGVHCIIYNNVQQNLIVEAIGNVTGTRMPHRAVDPAAMNGADEAPIIRAN